MTTLDNKTPCCNALYVVSISTRKGRRKICNHCGKEYPRGKSPQKELLDTLHNQIIDSQKRMNNPILVTSPHTESWEKRFDELLGAYRRGYEGENTALNKLRKEPNNVLEREIKSFIASELLRQKEEMRNCVNDVLSRKYEGVERINPVHERAILYCLSDEYSDKPQQAI